MRSSILSRSRAAKTDDNGVALEHLKEAAATTREGVRDLGSAAKEVASAELSRLQERASHLRDDTLAQVSKKPLTSLLVAAGAGLLLGFLIRRR